MKTMIKILSFLLVLLMLGGGAALAEGGGAFIVGTNAEFPPFEYIDDDGSFAGFDMELIGLILEALEVEYDYVTMEFDSLLPALASGKINIAVAAMTIREDRQENALFSDPYFNAKQKIIIQSDNAEIVAEEDLDGKKVGVQMGTTGDLYVSGVETYTAEVQRYSKALDAVIDLSNGRLDAVIVDEGPSAYFVAAIEGLTVLPEVFADEYYGMAMTLGSEEMMEKINAQLALFVEDGTYDALFEKYFGAVETGADAEGAQAETEAE